MRHLGLAIVLLLGLAAIASAAVTSQTLHGTQTDLLDLAIPPSSTDLIEGDLPATASGIGTMNGFRTDPPQTPAGEQFQAYTDGLGALSGLTGLLADNDPPVDGQIVQTVQYRLNDARVDEIRVFSGNADARRFSTFVVELSTDGGNSFFGIGPNSGYFQSDPTDTLDDNFPNDVSTLQRIFDDGGAPISLGVDLVKFDFYASGNNTPQSARDPFDGVNPFTGIDDTRPAANQSPLIWEVDIIQIPEPASMLLLSLALAASGLLYLRNR